MGLFRSGARPRAERALNKILKGVEAPTFPSSTLRILQQLRDPATEVAEIATCLEGDPGLVVRVLRTVNTSAYGPANPIGDVHHAVNYMGRAQLEQIVLALAVRDALPAGEARGFDSARFWRVSSKRAALARLLGSRLHPARAGEGFTGGLLQDMAVPVLAHAREAEYGPILEAWHGDGSEPLDRLERQALGWTHADVGGLLGKHWELPGDLTNQIFRHHKSDVGDDELLPALRLVALLGENPADDGVEALTETARADYGLEPDWIGTALGQAEAQAGELSQRLG